jgi:hypothetical protein
VSSFTLQDSIWWLVSVNNFMRFSCGLFVYTNICFHCYINDECGSAILIVRFLDRRLTILYVF